MRVLVWLTSGFAAACALGVCLEQTQWLIPAAAVCAFLAVALVCLSQRWKRFRVLAVLFLGMTLGAGWFCLYDGLYLRDAAGLDGKTGEAQIEISDYSWRTAYGGAADGYLRQNGRTYRVRVYLKDDAQLTPGDRIEGTFRFRYTGGGEKAATFHRGNGIFLLCYQRGDTVLTPAETLPWKYYPAYLRLRLKSLIGQLFSPEDGAFARALLLGDTTGLDYARDTALKISGIRHIVAVSGLHVTILLSVLTVLTGRRRGLMAALGLPLLALFALVAGMTPSVVRACIMQALMILAPGFRREYDPPTALAAAALTMLAVNPLVITSVSFLLSAGCVVGLTGFSGRISAWALDRKRFGRFRGKSLPVRLLHRAVQSVSVTLGATAVTMPLSAYSFGTVSLIGILTNLLTLWAVSLTFYAVCLSCLVGLFWTGGAKVLAAIGTAGIRYIGGVANLLSRFPVAAVYTRSIFIVIWIVGTCLAVGVFLLLRRKKPVLLAGGIAVGLCLALLLSWVQPFLGQCRVTVLNVGQGQCILLQSEGKSFLVDCGGSYEEDAAAAAAETLLSQGIDHLDGLILTHFDRDHADGAPLLLTRIPADCLYVPDPAEDETARQLLAAAPATSVDRDTEITFGGSTIRLYVPDSQADSNETSLFVLFQTENCAILITGDNNQETEQALLRRVTLPRLDVLVVGHHGSARATSEALLTATRPNAAVISVGKDNAYGHPTQEVLDRLEAAGCRIYRTDRDGTVIFKG